MSSHFVRHIVESGQSVTTEFQCTAAKMAPCRTVCRPCYEAEYDNCECGGMGELKDLGTCCWLPFITEDNPEEHFDGIRQPVCGPSWQPITLIWNPGDETYYWDYEQVTR